MCAICNMHCVCNMHALTCKAFPRSQGWLPFQALTHICSWMNYKISVKNFLTSDMRGRVGFSFDCYKVKCDIFFYVKLHLHHRPPGRSDSDFHSVLKDFWFWLIENFMRLMHTVHQSCPFMACCWLMSGKKCIQVLLWDCICLKISVSRLSMFIGLHHDKARALEWAAVHLAGPLLFASSPTCRFSDVSVARGNSNIHSWPNFSGEKHSFSFIFTI